MMQHRMHSFYMKAKQYCCFVKDWVIDEHSAADLTDLLMEKQVLVFQTQLLTLEVFQMQL